MPDKYRRYGNGGGVMGLSDRVKKQVRRDSERGGPDPKAESQGYWERLATQAAAANERD